MKINFLIPHLSISGGISVTMTFAQELSKRGHEVVVAVESQSLARHIRNLSNRHPLLPRHTRVKLMRVYDFDDVPDADIFFADSWKVAKRLYDMKVGGAKFQYIQHDERMYHGNPEAVEEVYRLPMRKFVNATWLHEIFKKEFNQETEILFNAIDCELFNPKKRNRKPDDKDIRILVLHHDYAWKGTAEGVRMVKTLQKKYPDRNIKLILYGTRMKHIDVSYDEYYYNVVGRELAGIFANSDIYLGCSIDDSRPIAHRWAMASGCALAMYDNVSTADYAVNGETALVATKKDSQDLSQKLEELIVNIDLRKKISENALAFVRQLLTWEQVTDTLENILNHA